MDIQEYALDDDIVAIATALAPAALSVIRTSGKTCFEKCATIFSNKEKLLKSKGYQIIHGWILEDEKKLDEVVLCTYRAPKSFTGEDSVEIMCHGGLNITMSIFQLLLKGGFRQAKPGEFTFRSFVSGKNDLLKAEAVKEIIDAQSNIARESATSRLKGTLSKQVETVKALLLSLSAQISVDVEYPEDENFTTGTVDTASIEKAIQILKSLVQNWESERIFKDGAKVVLAGMPNAGKSKLFNTLVKEERSIVSDIEGTTRDWINQDILVQGLPITLYDTAGLRFGAETIESIGIERTKELTSKADILLYLVDSSKGLQKEDLDFLQLEKYQDILKLLVFTKCDTVENSLLAKAQEKALQQTKEAKLNLKSVIISSQTGFGLDNLLSEIFRMLVKESPSGENITVGTTRQKNAVNQALYFLDHALQAAKLQVPSDTILIDIEEAMHFLSELTGEITSDDILNEIFLNFCVGK